MEPRKGAFSLGRVRSLQPLQRRPSPTTDTLSGASGQKRKGHNGEKTRAMALPSCLDGHESVHKVSPYTVPSAASPKHSALVYNGTAELHALLPAAP